MLPAMASSVKGSNNEMSGDQLMVILYRSVNDRRFVIIKYDSWSSEAWGRMETIFTYDDNRDKIVIFTQFKYTADYLILLLQK